MSRDSGTSRRVRKRTLAEDNEDTEEEEITRLRRENRHMASVLADVRQELWDARAMAEMYSAELTMADMMKRNLEMTLIDLEESNAQHALQKQHMLLQVSRAQSSESNAVHELVNTIERHAREVRLVTRRHEAERMRLAQDAADARLPACLVCAHQDEDTEWCAFATCTHVSCSGCRAKLSECPFCRVPFGNARGTFFKSWW
jgi:hypothetical protein